jgi:hypothetical protein
LGFFIINIRLSTDTKIHIYILIFSQLSPTRVKIMLIKWRKIYTIEQWFSTGVPRYITVLLRDVRGADYIDVYYIKCRQIVIFNQLEVPPIFWRPVGCREQKRLKNITIIIKSHWNSMLRNLNSKICAGFFIILIMF